jgi:hypothetical protein
MQRKATRGVALGLVTVLALATVAVPAAAHVRSYEGEMTVPNGFRIAGTEESVGDYGCHRAQAGFPFEVRAEEDADFDVEFWTYDDEFVDGFATPGDEEGTVPFTADEACIYLATADASAEARGVRAPVPGESHYVYEDGEPCPPVCTTG